jgi:hypothetical protein
MDTIEQGLCNIMNICEVEKKSNNFGRIEEKVYMVNDKETGAIIFVSYPNSYVYMVCIFAQVSLKQEIEEFLYNLCDEMEDDYGEDHRKEVKERDLKDMEEIISLSQKLKFHELIVDYLME